MGVKVFIVDKHGTVLGLNPKCVNMKRIIDTLCIIVKENSPDLAIDNINHEQGVATTVEIEVKLCT